MGREMTIGALKAPPHSLTMEQAILSGLMADSDYFDVIAEKIGESDFYSPRHAMIFRAIHDLVATSQPCDAILVAKWLEDMGLLEKAGGEAYLAQMLRDSPATTANIEAYAEQVREYSVFRQLIAVCNGIAERAMGPRRDSAEKILDEAETKIFSIKERHGDHVATGPKSLKDVLLGSVEAINVRESGSGGSFPTGYAELDALIIGLHPKDLVVIAGVPGSGKTTLAVNILENMQRAKALPGPAVVFSMEMGDTELGERMISSGGMVNGMNLRTARLDASDWNSISNAVIGMKDWQVYIDETPGLSPNELRARARRIAKRHGGKMGIVLVDYLQLMKVPGFDKDRVGEIGNCSRALKALAKELHCPVVALSQLSRVVSSRPDKRPVMSDLKGSGDIEQDADVVLFVYRDEIYHPNTEAKGMAEIIVGKQRKGPLGKVLLGFDGAYSKFKNLAKWSAGQD